MKITVKETTVTKKEIEIELPVFLKYKESPNLMIKVISENKVIKVQNLPMLNEAGISLFGFPEAYLTDSDYKPATEKEFLELYRRTIYKLDAALIEDIETII